MAASTASLPNPAIVGAAPRARNRLRRVLVATLVADLSMLALAVPLAVSMKFGPANWSPAGVQWFTGVPLIDFGWVVPVWLASLASQGLYSRRALGHGGDQLKTLLKGSLSAALVTSVVAYLANYDMSRGFYLYVFSVGTLLLLTERYVVARVVDHLRRADRLVQRVVAVGGAREVAHLAAVLAKRPELGLRLVAVCAPDGEGARSVAVPVVGGLEDAVRACDEMDADVLLVAGGSQLSSRELQAIGWELEGTDVDVVVVPSLLDVAGPRIHSRPVSGLPFLHIEPPQAGRAMRWEKAIFDRVASLLLLVLLSPLLAAIALAIRLDSSGPILFRHRRVGVAGKEFGLWKFRSMIPEAELRHADLVPAGNSVLLFKVKADPRVTRVGRFLRKYSLDELPQLVNVLLGDMSLVGPRPQVAAEVEAYQAVHHRRLMVRPGMTGLWQVSGRSNLTWEESVQLDLSYVDNWSLTGDLVILLRTVGAVLRHDGAY